MLGNPLLLGDDGYNISRSVRLRSSASAYFNRTFTTPTNNIKWTWSGWLKRGALSGYHRLFGVGSDVSGINQGSFYIDTAGFLAFFQGNGAGSTEISVATTALYRDPSAWYHIVLVYDSANATSSNRILMYVNGVQVTSFQTATYPSLSLASKVNAASVVHAMGVLPTSPSNYYDGLLTEVNFIDGQALTPSSFGETDSITGVWKPKKYAGTYGTNGFYLNFSDNSNNTAATIGKDYSGNGNNWTPNNISVTAGATYDSMLDTPTPYADGGNGRGNYCTLNPLWYSTAAFSAPSNGNLTFAGSYTAISGNVITSTMGLSSGKWYWEVTPTNVGAGPNLAVGIQGVSRGVSDSSNIIPGTGYYYNAGGSKMQDATSSAYGAAYAAGDVVGIALDLDGGTLTFYKNGTSQGTAFTGISAASTPTGAYTPMIHFGLGGAARTVAGSVNFGQQPFSYTPPTGFKALNTQNLPDATIKKGNAYFDATTYTGNGSTQSITNSGSMQPDLVWAKTRSSATHHALVDSVRGVDKYLYSSLTIAEETQTTALSSFNSNGFSLAGSFGNVNANGTTYVAWQWKESVSAGFDIVTYTGDGSAGRTIAHSLGVAPKMMIVKRRSAVENWGVYHASLPSAAYYVILNSTAAQDSGGGTIWNSTAPSSSVFTVGTSTYSNSSGSTYVNYLFAEVAGFSKFGSYTGNGSTDGPFVYLGFRPRFVLIKRTDTSGFDWILQDTSRSTYNSTDSVLNPNSSAAEQNGGGYNLDVLSNGFKVKNSGGQTNASGGTFIYAAFAENPTKYSLAR